MPQPLDLRAYELVVVGSGFYGLTVAERCASRLGRRVLVLERRNHIGGNAYSEPEPETGIEVHRYGAHLFHTSNEKVREYSRAAATSDEPYYPVNTAGDRERLERYRARAAAEADVLFGGRLGTYQYLDMHMAVAAALTLFDNVLTPHFRTGAPVQEFARRHGQQAP